jgi:hypothetical protein
MRDPKQHLGREVIFPQVPRVFHNGIKGTFMEARTHERYFARIATNFDERIRWTAMDSAITAAESRHYEERVSREMAAAESLKSVAKVVQVLNEGAKKDVVIWISASPAPTQQKMQFEPIALFFGIWHEARRGEHRGMHEMWYRDTHVFLVNVHQGLDTLSHMNVRMKIVAPRSYRHAMPKGIQPLVAQDFRGVTPPHKTPTTLKVGLRKKRSRGGA